MCGYPRPPATHRKVRVVHNSGPVLLKSSQRRSVASQPRANLLFLRGNDKPPQNGGFVTLTAHCVAPLPFLPFLPLSLLSKASGKDPIPSSCGVFVRFLVPSRRKSVGSGSPSTRRRGRGPCGSGEEEQAGESKSTAAVRAGRGIVQEVHLQGHLLVHGLHVKCFLRPRRREDVIHGQKGRKVGTRSVGKNNNNNNNNNKPENTSQFTTKTLCGPSGAAKWDDILLHQNPSEGHL
ncbi:uncharacterized protein LOC144017648 isoform X2 [Festucalex cinctus]